ncbi:NAD(P)H-binding protein [Streptomyces boluensis]|uniref:NAD(P)H-binding protein n=1 Tax=Streptomyces boluensis TaxID=1775135 RepID=UPI0028ADD5E1|nr:NAD(P)H-binding protein [Streptomyces boluensis]
MTGATGNVGREVVARLRSTGSSVRALTRAPVTRAPVTRAPVTGGAPGGDTAVRGDLSDPDTLTEAARGSRAAFLIWPFLSTDGAPAALRALARSTGRVVYLSSSGVDESAERQSDPINQMHADMERLVAECGVAEWTVLRADTLASNARGWAGQLRDTGVVRGPDIAATAVVHERDVAAVAAHALTEDGHLGARHVLTGPRVLSRAEQVAAVGAATGRPARFEPVPVEVARAHLLADGRPPALVDALLASAVSRRASRLVTSTVEEITGAPARTFDTWAEEYADLFR